MKKLSELLDVDINLNILGITDDSRKVKKGYLFVATYGFNVDHYDYIDEAIENGCVFIITDRKIKKDFPHKIVNNINYVYEEICRKYYDIDFDNYHFIGITGTDGKTTTATIVSKLIDNCSYIGTNGLTIKDKNISTNNTTPCICELYECLKKIKLENSSNVVMEVSSEALLHRRVDNLRFDIIAFTNITGDHLNIHGSFENYVNSKLKLLNLVNNDGCVIINNDDANLKNIKHNNLYTFGFSKNSYFLIKKVYYNKNGMIIKLKYNNKIITIESLLRGKYNVYNIVEAYIIGYLYGIDDKILLDRIKKISFISGRCEFLEFGQEYDIVLDYAHTINGIKSILNSFKNYKKIITVTGCAGGRDREKRSIIGNIVMDNSDIAIFTMDDPRYESVDSIINDMVAGRDDYIKIVDRKEAIRYALSIATSDSIVLILGKGRDNYMAIFDKKIKYCDYDVVSSYFEES